MDDLVKLLEAHSVQALLEPLSRLEAVADVCDLANAFDAADEVTDWARDHAPAGQADDYGLWLASAWRAAGKFAKRKRTAWTRETEVSRQAFGHASRVVLAWRSRVRNVQFPRSGWQAETDEQGCQ